MIIKYLLANFIHFGQLNNYFASCCALNFNNQTTKQSKIYISLQVPLRIIIYELLPWNGRPGIEYGLHLQCCGR